MGKADGAVQSYKLDLKTSDLEPENLCCRWTPDGDHIIVAKFDEPRYQRGQAAIFGADIGNYVLRVPGCGPNGRPLGVAPLNPSHHALSTTVLSQNVRPWSFQWTQNLHQLLSSCRVGPKSLGQPIRRAWWWSLCM